MNNSYQFDQFNSEQKQSEIKRLTSNVESHSQALTRLFLENGLIEAMRVLDVGCGTGAMIHSFSDILPSAKFYGVDNSEQILAAAKKITSIQDSPGNRINLDYSNADNLPFEDNSFDFVYTRLVLMHNANPTDIIREMIRVCKPGGTVCAVEFDDGTQIFHPHGEKLTKLIHANIEYARKNGTDRTIGRKLYSYFATEGLMNVKVLFQTSEYLFRNRENEDLPILIKFALGNDNGKRLVEAGLITEYEIKDLIENIIPSFRSNPLRYDSGSFMYAFGKK